MVMKAKKIHDLGPTVSLISLSTALRINDFRQQVRRETYAHVVPNATSLQLIPPYSSQSSGFAQTLAEVGLCESAQAGRGFWKQLLNRALAVHKTCKNSCPQTFENSTRQI
jgi:hypothetical protein